MSKETDGMYELISKEIDRLKLFLREHKNWDKIFGYGYLGRGIAFRYSDCEDQFIVFRLPEEVSTDVNSIQDYYAVNTLNKVHVGIGKQDGSAALWLTCLWYKQKFDVYQIERYLMEITT